MAETRVLKDVEAAVVPKSCLHAAQLEDDGIGRLKIVGYSIVYFDAESKHPVMMWDYTTSVEAGLQLVFYRIAYQDKKKALRHIEKMQDAVH